MPRVSVMMPTYNRADTILRAIRSVQAQTYSDWELIIVDDGSTDDTPNLIQGLDSRIKVIRQENRGFAEARNTGFRHATGSFLSFLDSDDEWLPHHLELSVAFLSTHLDQDVVTSDLLERFSDKLHLSHYRVELDSWYPRVAKIVGSHMLDLPPGETDPFLRVYSHREEIGDWGKEILSKTPYKDAKLYSGRIFEQMRWGFLLAMQPTVITKRAFDKVGPLDTSYSIAADFGFGAALARNFQINYITAPSCVKHEYGDSGSKMRSDHISSGASAPKMCRAMLRYLDELYISRKPSDRELRTLRCYRQYYLGITHLSLGDRGGALRELKGAGTGKGSLWRAYLLYLFTGLIPSPATALLILGMLEKIRDRIPPELIGL